MKIYISTVVLDTLLYTADLHIMVVIAPHMPCDYHPETMEN